MFKQTPWTSFNKAHKDNLFFIIKNYFFALVAFDLLIEYMLVNNNLKASF